MRREPLSTVTRAGALLALALVAAACGDLAHTEPAGGAGGPGDGDTVVLGRLEDAAIDESSGVVASRRAPGVFWTHNDSSGEPSLYAFDRKGASRGTWRVRGAKMTDWEDIAAGPGPKRGVTYLYIGDIGDNTRRRKEIVVYRVPEPDASARAPRGAATQPAEAIRLRYPDGSHDAETLVVHPKSGDLYVVTKALGGDAGVYKAKAPLAAGKAIALERVARLEAGSLLGGFFTGGDIAPDGTRLVLCDYFSAYELALPPGARSFDAIWKQTPRTVRLDRREQGEAICYRLDGKALVTTSEGRRSPVVEYRAPVSRGSRAP